MKKTIYALGFFDGVHLGHQALLNECRRLAAEFDAVCEMVMGIPHVWKGALPRA